MKIQKILDRGLVAQHRWTQDGTDTGDGELQKIFRQVENGHKWHHYFPIYEDVFGRLRAKPIKVLEIGVYKGASLQMWRKYFHPDSTIVGLDIDASCARFNRPAEKTFVRIGDQKDRGCLQRIVDEFGRFDLIIDDGSHVTSHMIGSFNFLFDHGLKQGGIYFLEDLHTNYWIGYRDSRNSFVDMAKEIVDLMHAHYFGNQTEIAFRLNHQNRLQYVDVPRITMMVDEIRFMDSVIVIYKSLAERKLPISEHR